jgi:glycosyltransferase involved in cell wall biosynthesis
MPGKVTVCIPAFNAESFIALTLRSVLDQPGVSEVYVSDNHSTDRTAQQVQQFEDRGVKLVRCPVPSVQTGDPLDNCCSAINNWNSLLEYGTGDYVALYHADDVYEPGILAEEAAFLDRHTECSVVFTLGQAVDERGHRLRIWNSQLWKWLGHDRLFDYPDLVQAMLEWGSFLHTPTAMIRRGAWRKVGGLSAYYEQACDVDWWLRLAKAGPVGVIRRVLYKRRLWRFQDSMNGKSIYRYCELPIFRVLDDCLRENGLRARVPTAVLRKYELQRAGDRVGPAVAYVAEGKWQQGVEQLEACSHIGLGEVLRTMKSYPRQVVQILLGKLLLQACRAGSGRMLARHLDRHRTVRGR